MRGIRPASRVPLFVLATLLLTASPGESQNPLTSAADVAEGRRIFELDCASCHGGDARGGRGPDLTRGTFRHASDDDDLFEIVRNGIQGTEMPRRVRTDPRAWRVVAYLRSLGGTGELPPGDPARGRELFFGSANCSTCHVVAGEGSMQGPDLTLIGYMRSTDYLRSSLQDPNSEVDPRWWSAQLTTFDGVTASGYLLANDLHTVRLLDGNNQLRAFSKERLEQFEPIKTSRMPSYDGVLVGEDFDNVIAYLASLRGRGEGAADQ